MLVFGRGGALLLLAFLLAPAPALAQAIVASPEYVRENCGWDVLNVLSPTNRRQLATGADPGWASSLFSTPV